MLIPPLWLGIPIPPCGFSLAVSNPCSLTCGYLLRLRSASCPEVMSNFGDGGLHVKGSMCNFRFQRRVISPLPPPQFPALRLRAQASEVSFHSIVESHRQVSVLPLKGGWDPWLKHSSSLSQSAENGHFLLFS